MIRQAISCDICGAEKKQTNHWFVAWEQTGELRVSGWNSRNRLRAGSKHLCGQVCLHKLADDFMARVIAGKSVKEQAAAVDEMAAEDEATENVSTGPALGASPGAERDSDLRASPFTRTDATRTDTSLTAAVSCPEVESTARLLPSAPMAKMPVHGGASLAAVPDRAQALPAPLEEAPRYSSRNWRAEAWKRERERTQRAG